MQGKKQANLTRENVTEITKSEVDRKTEREQSVAEMQLSDTSVSWFFSLPI